MRKNTIRLTESRLRNMIYEVITESIGNWNEDMFRDDLAAYINASREYDGSVMAANHRHRCLMEVLGSLPWDVDGYKFERFMATYLSFGPDIEDQVEYAVNWVKNQLESKPRAPRVVW